MSKDEKKIKEVQFKIDNVKEYIEQGSITDQNKSENVHSSSGSSEDEGHIPSNSLSPMKKYDNGEVEM